MSALIPCSLTQVKMSANISRSLLTMLASNCPAERGPPQHLLMGPSTKVIGQALALFWLNRYGPEVVMPSVSFYKAIADNDPDVPPGFFRNKVVFVGEKLETYRPGERKDEYSNPFSYRMVEKWYSGVGIHGINTPEQIIRGRSLSALPQRERSRIRHYALWESILNQILVACRPFIVAFAALLARGADGPSGLLPLPLVSWMVCLLCSGVCAVQIPPGTLVWVAHKRITSKYAV